MLSPPLLSKAARDAGVPPRFVYWQGRSRRRYLFTRTTFSGLGDFADGVILLVEGGQVVWAGEAGDLASLPAGLAVCESAVYVHLLAADPADRRLIVGDFLPDWDREHRMAA